MPMSPSPLADPDAAAPYAAAASIPSPAPASPSFFRRIAPVGLALLAVWIFGFGGGYLAGRKKWIDPAALRALPIAELNRNLELRAPGYGDILQGYRRWERRKLYGYIFAGEGGKALLLVFFNNWVAANLTMVVRAATIVPMLLYPFGRFLQGLTIAQGPATFQVWATLICEFGGYLLTIWGTLCALAWLIFFRRFGFVSRRAALRYGLKTFAGFYALSGFFLLIGSYVETMYVIGMSIR
jgi:hypothetical protein